jgi:hypothetical protein
MALKHLLINVKSKNDILLFTVSMDDLYKIIDNSYERETEILLTLEKIICNTREERHIAKFE